MRTYNDDLIMSLAIGCWVRDTALEVSQKETEYQKAMLAGMYSTNKTLNTAIKGMNEYRKRETITEKYEKEIQITKDFPWIFKG